MQSVRAVQSAARDKADLAAEELRDALLPLGLGAALREAPRDAALGSAVDVQRRRQAACAHDSESRHLLTGEAGIPETPRHCLGLLCGCAVERRAASRSAASHKLGDAAQTLQQG